MKCNMNRVEQLESIQNEARALFKRKNADYGDAFATCGLIGVLVRIQDKINRFVKITNRSVQFVDDESIRDTLMDLHNYAAMGIMLDEPVETNSLKVCKLKPDAILPKISSDGAVGYDLYSFSDVTVYAYKRTLVDTGISMSLPYGTYGRVAPRSGLSVKNGINVGAGVIDPDYTGEVKVLLFNHSDENFEIKKGDRIAQLIIEKCDTPLVEEVDMLDTTERGEGGFGSTGR